jgi:hypothetical protein
MASSVLAEAQLGPTMPAKTGNLLHTCHGVQEAPAKQGNLLHKCHGIQQASPKEGNLLHKCHGIQRGRRARFAHVWSN